MPMLQLQVILKTNKWWVWAMCDKGMLMIGDLYVFQKLQGKSVNCGIGGANFYRHWMPLMQWLQVLFCPWILGVIAFGSPVHYNFRFIFWWNNHKLPWNLRSDGMGPLFQFFNIIHSDNIERDWQRRNSAYQGFSLFTFSLARTPNIQVQVWHVWELQNLVKLICW